MLRVWPLLLAASFVSPTLVGAQDFVPPLQLNAVQARLVDGEVTLEMQVTRDFAVTRVTVTKLPGNKYSEKAEVIQLPEIHTVLLQVDGKDVRVYNLKGEAVKTEELPMRLGINGAVVMSPSGKVPAQFKQILREDTLVLSVTGKAARLLKE